MMATILLLGDGWNIKNIEGAVISGKIKIKVKENLFLSLSLSLYIYIYTHTRCFCHNFPWLITAAVYLIVKFLTMINRFCTQKE